MRLSDTIEQFIKDMISEEPQAEVDLKRNELAAYFHCAPSQINYVLSTRFTPDPGYVTSSQRGGGGYIRIVRIVRGDHEQLAYLLSDRIGDAITNPICPTFAYFGMLLALAQKYDKKSGFGTLMSNMLPYVICYFVFMVIELLFWFFLKIPFGPGGPVLLNG